MKKLTALLPVCVMCVSLASCGELNKIPTEPEPILISGGAYHTVGLKNDGTVVATKILDSSEDYGQSNVEGWDLNQ